MAHHLTVCDAAPVPVDLAGDAAWPEPHDYRIMDGDRFEVLGVRCTACGEQPSAHDADYRPRVFPAAYDTYVSLCALCGGALETPQHSLFGSMVHGRFVPRPDDAHGFQEPLQ